jgi:hypothetical protein
MVTFHPFPRLPAELRDQIWEMTVEPRTIDVRVCRDRSWKIGRLVSSTPVPATLQSCREARNHLQRLYRRAFSELDQRPGSERRYVWTNLDMDLVSIGRSMFDDFELGASSIKRLKFERDNDDEYWYNTESRKLMLFSNADEIHVDCADGFWMWSGSVNNDFAWPCADENLFFIQDDGEESEEMVTGIELEALCRRMLKEARLADCGEAWSTGDEFED